MMLTNREKRMEFIKCVSGLNTEPEPAESNNNRLLKFIKKDQPNSKSSKTLIIQLNLLFLFLQSQKYHVDTLIDNDLFSEIWGLLRSVLLMGDASHSELTHHLQLIFKELAKLYSEGLFLKIRSFLKKQNNLLLVQSLFLVDLKVWHFPSVTVNNYVDIPRSCIRKQYEISRLCCLTVHGAALFTG